MAASTIAAGEECTVVLFGRMFRCVVRQANLREQAQTTSVQAFGSSYTQLVPTGVVHRALSIEYDVLEELQLDAAQTTQIAGALAVVAQEARDRGERQIDL